MDSLPDELLLLVLSHVRDGRTLLDAVPLVCRRWYALHREPYVWRNVPLTCASGQDDARVLLHAPALLSLRVAIEYRSLGGGGACVVPERADDVRRFACALRRTRAVGLRRVAVPMAQWTLLADEDGDVGVLGAVVGVLKRNRDTLHAVDVHLAGGCAPLLRAIAGLRGLRRARLTVGVDVDEYDGELRAATFALEGLRVSACHRGGWRAYAVPDAIIADLVRGAASSLTALHTDMNCSLEVASLASLRDLRLLVPRATFDSPEYEDGVNVRPRAVVTELKRVLSACRGLAELRTFAVAVPPGYALQFPSALKNECVSLLQAFLGHRPEVIVWERTGYEYRCLAAPRKPSVAARENYYFFCLGFCNFS